jgi:hypothetical protein
MQTRSRGDYTIAGSELVGEGTDLWRYHTKISDSFVCLEGGRIPGRL